MSILAARKAIALVAWLAAASVSDAFVLPSSKSTRAQLLDRQGMVQTKPDNNQRYKKLTPISTKYPSAATALGNNLSHSNNNDKVHDKYYSFDEMKNVESRLGNLEKEAPGMISAFYEPHLKSFSVRPGSVKVREFSLKMNHCMSLIYCYYY